jgi:hypothetical protein
MTTTAIHASANTEADAKELKYYTASQWQLVWWRFRKHRMAMVGAVVLLVMGLMGALAGFVAPYSQTSRDRAYIMGAPQLPRLWDHKGVSLRPFVHGITTKRDPVTLRKVGKPIPTARAAATRVGSPQSVLKEGVVLLHMAGGRSQPGARIFHVGDEVVVHNRVRAQRPEAVRLMGHQLPVGMLVRLETGDWLNLAADAPRRVDETFIFVGGEALEAASAVRRQNERYDRETEDPGLGLVPDPLRDRSSPFLDLVARSVDMALLALPEERADALSEGFHIQLTLKRGVQLERLMIELVGLCILGS